MLKHTGLSPAHLVLLTALMVLASARFGPAQTLDRSLSRVPIGAPATIDLADLFRLGLERNPNLRQADLEIEATEGRALQAGLYPNPTVSLAGEEIGRRGGIQTLPLFSQEIVRGGKRELSRAVVDREVEQARCALLRQRNTLFTKIRQGYFEMLAIQRRIEVLDDLVQLAQAAADNAKKLYQQQQIAELDMLPFEVELERLRADSEAARREQSAAWGRLAATLGAPELQLTRVQGSLEMPLPDYQVDAARDMMLQVHPDLRIAELGIARAQLAVQREQAQVVPNVTMSGGYSRNFNDRENQATYQVSVPIPVWNRNQGNIRAAQAELGQATQEIARVQNDLTARLWTAFGQYSAARQRAERYRTTILPAAKRTYQLSAAAFQGGQFQYLRVLQAQRAIAEANLEYLRALTDTWQAASELAGLLQEPLPRSKLAEIAPR